MAYHIIRIFPTGGAEWVKGGAHGVTPEQALEDYAAGPEGLIETGATYLVIPTARSSYWAIANPNGAKSLFRYEAPSAPRAVPVGL